MARAVTSNGHIVLDKGDESRIAEVLKVVQTNHPTVYVKSRGQKFEDGPRLTVVLSLGGDDLAIIRQEVQLTEDEAHGRIERLGLHDSAGGGVVETHLVKRATIVYSNFICHSERNEESHKLSTTHSHIGLPISARVEQDTRDSSTFGLRMTH